MFAISSYICSFDHKLDVYQKTGITVQQGMTKTSLTDGANPKWRPDSDSECLNNLTNLYLDLIGV